MPRVIGLDPGSRTTGFGVIEYRQGALHYVASGSIRTDRHLPYLDRLPIIVEGIAAIVRQHRPDMASIEQAFVARNPGTAIKLVQVRGIAIGLLILHSIPIHEYAPREIKKVVTGKGNAGKQQVQYMVQKLLNLKGIPGEDAADALAVAISHIRNL